MLLVALFSLKGYIVYNTLAEDSKKNTVVLLVLLFSWS